MHVLAVALVISAFSGALAAPADTATEARLQTLLDGRVAGPAVECIETKDIRRKWIVPGTAMLFETADAIYVSRPQSGSTSLRAHRSLGWGTSPNFPRRVCKGHGFSLLTLDARQASGVAFAGEFVPYRKAGPAN